MTRLDEARVRKEWAATLDLVVRKGERVAVSRHGKLVAVLVSAEDLRILEALEDRLDLEEARRSLTEARKKGTVPWAKVRAAAVL